MRRSAAGPWRRLLGSKLRGAPPGRGRQAAAQRQAQGETPYIFVHSCAGASGCQCGAKFQAARHSEIWSLMLPETHSGGRADSDHVLIAIPSAINKTRAAGGRGFAALLGVPAACSRPRPRLAIIMPVRPRSPSQVTPTRATRRPIVCCSMIPRARYAAWPVPEPTSVWKTRWRAISLRSTPHVTMPCASMADLEVSIPKTMRRTWNGLVSPHFAT